MLKYKKVEIRKQFFSHLKCLLLIEATLDTTFIFLRGFFQDTTNTVSVSANISVWPIKKMFYQFRNWAIQFSISVASSIDKKAAQYRTPACRPPSMPMAPGPASAVSLHGPGQIDYPPMHLPCIMHPPHPPVSFLLMFLLHKKHTKKWSHWVSHTLGGLFSFTCNSRVD